MPYGAGMAGLPGAMPGYPGMYNQAQYPAYMAAPYGLHSPYALNAMHPGYPSYPQAPPAPLARPARSVLPAGERAELGVCTNLFPAPLAESETAETWICARCAARGRHAGGGCASASCIPAV